MQTETQRSHDKFAATTAAFGKLLARTRKECGITQEELEDRTGISQADLSRYENGRGNPSLKTMCRLAGGMCCNLELAMHPAAENGED